MKTLLKWLPLFATSLLAGGFASPNNWVGVAGFFVFYTLTLIIAGRLGFERGFDEGAGFAIKEFDAQLRRHRSLSFNSKEN